MTLTCILVTLVNGLNLAAENRLVRTWLTICILNTNMEQWAAAEAEACAVAGSYIGNTLCVIMHVMHRPCLSCRAVSAAASMPLCPSCKGLKLPAMYTRPPRGASTITFPLLYSTVCTLPFSSALMGSAISVVSSCNSTDVVHG